MNEPRHPTISCTVFANGTRASCVYNDGGRKDAGCRGIVRDCVVRAIAIVSGRTYASVYEALNEAAKSEHPRNAGKRSSSRAGVKTATVRRYLATAGYKWTPTMHIGSGCKVHLRPDELPPGRLIVRLSRHLTAVIDGIIYDTADPSREGTRCVYGYWTKLLNEQGGLDR